MDKNSYDIIIYTYVCIRSHDGNILAVTSTDGFCTLITFEDGELGVPYKDQVIHVKSKQQLMTEQQADEQKSKSKPDLEVDEDVEMVADEKALEDVKNLSTSENSDIASTKAVKLESAKAVEVTSIKAVEISDNGSEDDVKKLCVVDSKPSFRRVQMMTLTQDKIVNTTSTEEKVQSTTVAQGMVTNMSLTDKVLGVTIAQEKVTSSTMTQEKKPRRVQTISLANTGPGQEAMQITNLMPASHDASRQKISSDGEVKFNAETIHHDQAMFSATDGHLVSLAEETMNEVKSQTKSFANEVTSVPETPDNVKV